MATEARKGERGNALDRGSPLKWGKSRGGSRPSPRRRLGSGIATRLQARTKLRPSPHTSAGRGSPPNFARVGAVARGRGQPPHYARVEADRGRHRAAHRHGGSYSTSQARTADPSIIAELNRAGTATPLCKSRGGSRPLPRIGIGSGAATPLCKPAPQVCQSSLSLPGRGQPPYYARAEADRGRYRASASDRGQLLNFASPDRRSGHHHVSTGRRQPPLLCKSRGGSRPPPRIGVGSGQPPHFASPDRKSVCHR